MDIDDDDTANKAAQIIHNMSLRPPSVNHPKQQNVNNPDKIMDKVAIDTSKLFEGNTFYIANVGAKNKRTGVRKHWTDLSQKRVQLFNTLIPKHGGDIVDNINALNVSHEHPLIIIVSEKIKKHDFDQLFTAEMQNDNRFRFVIPDFISHSLTFQTKLSIHLDL